jgi:tetratricopeptide (TPR) repeat protein
MSRFVVAGAIEPSLRDAEIERVKRKRPENLDAYDLVLRATPWVYAAMPEQASKAIPLLEQALALEADYATAHGLLAWCQEILFMRAGFTESNRIRAIRHARAALHHARDDAMALSLAGFVIGVVEHDYQTAVEMFERALALSPSSAFTLFMGSDFAGSHIFLAAALAKLGRAEATKAAAMQVLALQPSFSAREYCAAVGFAPALAEPLTDAWRPAGLP